MSQLQFIQHTSAKRCKIHAMECLGTWPLPFLGHSVGDTWQGSIVSWYSRPVDVSYTLAQNMQNPDNFLLYIGSCLPHSSATLEMFLLFWPAALGWLSDLMVCHVRSQKCYRDAADDCKRALLVDVTTPSIWEENGQKGLCARPFEIS